MSTTGRSSTGACPGCSCRRSLPHLTVALLIEYMSKLYCNVQMGNDNSARPSQCLMAMRGDCQRDLKCANIFITADGLLKLGDFGAAKILRATHYLARTGVGTPYYMYEHIALPSLTHRVPLTLPTRMGGHSSRPFVERGRAGKGPRACQEPSSQ